MQAIKYMDEDIVIKKGMEVLVWELGPVEAMRFVNIPKRKRIESVVRHRMWQNIWRKTNSWSRRIMETFSLIVLVTPRNQRRLLRQVSLFLHYQKFICSHHEQAAAMAAGSTPNSIVAVPIFSQH